MYKHVVKNGSLFRGYHSFGQLRSREILFKNIVLFLRCCHWTSEVVLLCSEGDVLFVLFIHDYYLNFSKMFILLCSVFFPQNFLLFVRICFVLDC